MYIGFKIPKFRAKNILIILIITGCLIWAFSIILGSEIKIAEAILFSSSLSQDSTLIQKNNLLSISNSVDPIRPVEKIEMVVTAYSSTPEETDDSPFITASGKTVEEGIVANNLLPFGTKIRIPELYGDKIFVVEDRMNWTKGHYHLDIWFPNYQQAKDFGAKNTYIEILES